MDSEETMLYGSLFLLFFQAVTAAAATQAAATQMMTVLGLLYLFSFFSAATITIPAQITDAACVRLKNNKGRPLRSAF